MKAGTAVRTASVCLASVLFSAHARADPVRDCNSRDIDRRITGCTSVLNGSRVDDQNKALLHARRGQAYLSKQDYKAAAGDFTTCIKLKPDDKYCRQALSMVKCDTAVTTVGDVAGVEEHCTYLKNSTQEAQQAHYHTILGLAHFGRYKHGRGTVDPALAKTLEHLSKAIAIREKIGAPVADDYDLRGMAYLQNKEPGSGISPDADKALQDFNTAISLDASKAMYHLGRGYAHNQLLKPEEAWLDFKKARELDPSNAEIEDAYNKQWKYSPEGQAEIQKRLDGFLDPSPEEKK